MQKKYYKMVVPAEMITLMKFNECQEKIIAIEERIGALLNKEQRHKLVQAYNLLEDVQYWLVDNEMNILTDSDNNYILGTVFLQESEFPPISLKE